MPHFRKHSIKHYTTKRLWCQIALLFLLAGLFLAALAAALYLDNTRNRGVVWGADLPRFPQADVPPVGVNLFLDREPDEATIRRTLEMARDMGAHWVKQQFPWDQIEPAARGDFWDERYNRSTWDHYDRIVALCQEYGLELIVRLDRPPDWARPQALASEAIHQAQAEDPDRDITGPPDNLADYGDYVYAVVSRYRGQVHYVQLWNEPNLANEWNWAPIDPPRFVELLRTGYTRAKEADPNVVVLFPSLAYNDGLDPRHMSDLAFLDAAYQAGARDYFDVMSAQYYGLGQPPDEHSPLGFDRQHLRLITRTDVSRVVLLREIMEQHGDGGKAVWVGELGWNATPPDWTGRPSIWGQSVDEETKGRYIVAALERARREWPWMGVCNIWFLRWGGPPPHTDDPTQFFALVDYDFHPLPAYQSVRAWAADPPLGVGYHSLLIGKEAPRPFLGTRLDIVLPAGSDPQAVRVAVDGQPCPLVFWRNEGGEARYIAATGLSDDRHTFTLQGPAGLTAGCYVVREQPLPWLFPLLVTFLSLGPLAVAILLMLRLPAGLADLWPRLWRTVERFQSLPERWQALIVLGGLALCLAAIYRPVPLPLALLSLLMMGLLAVLRPDLATITAVFLIPLYAQPATLAGGRFSLFELTVLVCTAAGILHFLRPKPDAQLDQEVSIPRSGELGRMRGFGPLRTWRWGEILPPLVFLLVCTGSLLWSTDRSFITADGTGLLHVSLREFRVTVIEPFLLYPLLWLSFRSRRERAWWPVDALVLSGALVAVGGIVQVFTPWMHAEVADGVRRATSVYGTFSANALALFLGRVLALAVAGGLFLRWGRRRWLYLAALPLLGGAFFLTYSRGGYIAIVVVLLVYGLVHSRLLLWAELGLGAGTVLFAWITGGIGRLLALDTFRNRLTMWRNAWTLIRERPLQGLGLDAFYHYYRQRFPLEEEAYLTPHNWVFEFWTRLGLLGLAAAAWLYGAFFVRAWRAYRRLEDPAGRVLALGLLGSVVYALAHGLLDGTFFAPDWAATFWLAYGLVAVLR
jgi:O-antigen ligase